MHVDVFTNHKSLQYVFTKKELNIRQRIWLELLKDYDMSVLYPHGKVNVVVDALSCMTRVELVRDVHRLSHLCV